MSPSRARPLQAARTMLGLTYRQLWLDYVGLGGTLPPDTIRAFLDGQREVSDHDHDVIGSASERPVYSVYRGTRERRFTCASTERFEDADDTFAAHPPYIQW